MIEQAMQERLKRIFGVKKVSYDMPGPEVVEQDCLFVEVEAIRNSFKDKRHLARVTGRLFIASQAQKMPFGSLAKKIAEADAADTIDFFFFDFEENVRRFQNIVGRSLSFVFFYSTQYNPDQGILNQVTTQEGT